jgi:hypothetical protein
MSGATNRNRSVRGRSGLAGVLFLTAAWTAGTALAQSPPSVIDPAAVLPNGVPPSKAAPPPLANTFVDTGIIQTSCPNCDGGASLPPPAAPAPAYYCGEPGGCGCGQCKGCGCIPGQPKCYCECCCDPETYWGRLFSGWYNCLCCPDPCWLPHWDALRDVAFFQDAARPVTQTKLIYDNGWDFKDPDRAEFMFARSRTNPNQIGPGNGPNSIGKGLQGIIRRLDYHEVSLYTEAAAGAAGIYFSIPYLHISPEAGAANAALSPPFANSNQALAAVPVPGAGALSNTGSGAFPESGFGDITIGIKSLIVDCDCVQFGFEFKTYLPSGDFTKWLGTGHVSLEPSFLIGIKLNEDWFSQMQIAYWIPVGGDQLYDSGVFHYHVSLNRYLWVPCPGLKLVGTIEANEWTVCDGNYTEPDALIGDPSMNRNGMMNPNFGRLSPFAHSATSTICSVGPGFRFVVCDKIDAGVGTAFAVTGVHWAAETVRFEFRWRF